MPVESSVSKPEDLNPTWPLNTDQAKFGAAHIRNLKVALKTLNTSLASGDLFKFFVPSGGIIMWSGATDNIPDGWVLCNGQNNTPDLRNRFVLGAGETYEVGSTGGATSVTSSSDGEHTPSATVQSTTLNANHLPSHRHDLEIRSGSGRRSGDNTRRYWVEFNSAFMGNTDSAGPWQSLSSVPGGSTTDGYSSQMRTTLAGGSSSPQGHTHEVSVDKVPNHTHSVSVIPPYYALAFIMKL